MQYSTVEVMETLRVLEGKVGSADGTVVNCAALMHHDEVWQLALSRYITAWDLKTRLQHRLCLL